jgi:hypothetical protein
MSFKMALKEALDNLIENIMIQLHKNKNIQFDFSYLTIDNQDIFDVEMDSLITSTHFHSLYNKLISRLYKTYNADIVLSFSDMLSVNLNSVMRYECNIETIFVKQNKVLKKSIYNINKLLQFSEKDNNKNYSILVPILIYDETKTIQLAKWIKLLSKIINIKRIIYVNIVCLKSSIPANQTLSAILDAVEITCLTINLVNPRIYFEILWKHNEINKSDFNKINMFLGDTEDSLNKHILSKKQLANPLFITMQTLIRTKNSNICVSLENIADPTEIIKYVNLLASYIMAVKINSNNIYNESLLNGLKKLANHHNLIIIDDKKVKIKSEDDLIKLNSFQYADICSVYLDCMSQKIEVFLDNIRKTINPHASLLLLADDQSNLDNVRKHYAFFDNYVCGVIADNSLTLSLSLLNNDMYSFINYKHVKQINDNFRSLQKADILVIENELYLSKNPLEIVNKINTIMSQNKHD